MPKALTREQLQARKEKAVRFTRDVLDDADRAEEIAEESLEEYAARRKIAITNPCRRTKTMATKRELEEQIRELEQENSGLQDQLDAVADIVSEDDEAEEDEAEEDEEEEDED
jgi:hypothetical protein